MRIGVLVRLVFGCIAAGPLASCMTASSFDGARMYAGFDASYAGRFRLAHGRWPATVGELEEFTCMRDHADRYGMMQPSCDELVSRPYRTEFFPRGADLQMQFFDSSNEKVCSLRVRAPKAGSETSIFPMIVIETSVFSCPGDR